MSADRLRVVLSVAILAPCAGETFDQMSARVTSALRAGGFEFDAAAVESMRTWECVQREAKRHPDPDANPDDADYTDECRWFVKKLGGAK